MYVTGVVPTVKKSPGSAVWRTRIAVPELSEAVGSVKNTTTPELLMSVLAV